MSPELAATLRRIQALSATLPGGERSPSPPVNGGGTNERRTSERVESPAHVQRVANISHVKEHFLETYPDRADLANTCDTILGCSLLESEDLLLKELGVAERAQDASHIEELRKLLHAVSWMNHKPAPKELHKLTHVAKQSLTHARELLDRLAAERAAHARVDPSEAHEIFASRSEDVQTIIRAIEQGLSGENAEQATKAIEGFIVDARKTLTFQIGKGRSVDWHDVSTRPEHYQKQRGLLDTLQELRLIRDQIYYQRLYPDWFAKRKEPPHALASA